MGITLNNAHNPTQAVTPTGIRQQGGITLSASSLLGISGNLAQSNYVPTSAGVRPPSS